MTNKIIDGAKYVGKNFWKVLPIGSKLNHVRKNKKEKEESRLIYETKSTFHDVYAGISVVFIAGYIAYGAITGVWAPKKIKQYNEKLGIEAEMKIEHQKEINYEFERIFRREDAKTFQDSVDVYQKYGLPIRLLEPTMNEKEEAVKKNQRELEKKIIEENGHEMGVVILNNY